LHILSFFQHLQPLEYICYALLHNAIINSLQSI